MRPLRLSISLLSLGLALLAVFLYLFLKKTYDDEAATLRRETNLLFVNAVRSEESRVFDQLLVRKFNGSGDSTFHISLQIPRLPHADSVKMVAFVQERREFKTVFKEKSDTPRMLHIERNEPNEPGNVSVSGTLSMFVAHDSMPLEDRKPLVLNVLQKNFGEAMQKSGLPVAWQILRLGVDSTHMRRPASPDEMPPAPTNLTKRVRSEADSSNQTFAMQKPGTFIAGEYNDLMSGERYGAEISAYRGYLLQKVLPQLLFAVLLFACVVLAFGLIYRSFRQQQRLTELKNDFIRNMTHELKTPISTVSVAIEALQSFDALQDPVRTREYLDISRLELNRLSMLVDKVLRMSLFEQGEPELKSEPLDLRQLVEEVLAAMKIQFEKYRAEVDFSTSGDNFTLQGDRLHLTSVVYNLLDNALKYSTSTPKITLSLSQSEGQMTLRVSDQGRGIPSAYRERIFEKFFRVPTGDVHDVKGHGLGLSYVAGVVRLHGGSIEVESQEGKGTSFEVKLPFR